MTDPLAYITVVCETDSKYSGKCYMENISTVKMLNLVSISKDTALKKSDFKTGDVVMIRFQNKDFRSSLVPGSPRLAHAYLLYDLAPVYAT